MTVSRRLLVGVILAGTLSVLDSTIVVPLLTSIGADLGGGTAVSWLVAAYLLASTVTIPLWGRWMDLRGERAPMWSALALFTGATVLAAIAPSLDVLILARVLQGVGAGGVVPLGQAVLAARCSQEERARLQIYYNIAYGSAAGLGPLVGGALVGLSWRWAFVIVVPFALASGLALVGELRKEPIAKTVPRFDPTGTVLVTVGLTMLLLGVERSWWWLVPVSLTILVVFVVHARRRGDGLIPARVLANRMIIGCTVAGLLVGFVQFSFLTYLPMLSKQVAPDLNSGVVVVPLTVLWMTLGAVTGMLALRVGSRSLIVASAGCAAAAGMVVATWPFLPGYVIASTLVGASAGLALIPALLLAQHAAARAEIGAATSLFVLLRNFGGALGAAVTAVLLVDLGQHDTFLILAVVGAAVLLPTLLLPGRAAEAALR